MIKNHKVPEEIARIKQGKPKEYDSKLKVNGAKKEGPDLKKPDPKQKGNGAKPEGPIHGGRNKKTEDRKNSP